MDEETLSGGPKRLDELSWVVCPVCHKELRAGDGSVECSGCGRRYPIVDGIPVLLAERAI
jgi:uncharacterized protein YbaR (Trm112 family)